MTTKKKIGLAMLMLLGGTILTLMIISIGWPGLIIIATIAYFLIAMNLINS